MEEEDFTECSLLDTYLECYKCPVFKQQQGCRYLTREEMREALESLSPEDRKLNNL